MVVNLVGDLGLSTACVSCNESSLLMILSGLTVIQSYQAVKRVLVLSWVRVDRSPAPIMSIYLLSARGWGTMA